jgi:hypothetical protein
MNQDLIEQGYSEIKVLETRESHIDQSLLAKEHFAHYMAVADFLSKSSMVPKPMQNKPADVLIAMEMGLQLGIPMMQAIQDIAVINGKPVMYGDGLLAVVQGHKEYEWIKESVTNGVAMCVIKRKNHEPHTVTFSADDAKKAGLWGRPGPWSQYPERMLQMRARGFCIRDIFSDALRGIKTDEEVSDYQLETKPAKETPSNALKSLLSKKNKKEEEKTLIIMSTEEQHNEIDCLMIEKSFSKERLLKAKAHYKINEINELTHAQAEEFINVLKKEPLILND